MAEENPTIEERKNKLLFARDHKGRPVLHLTVLNSEFEVLQKLWV